MLGGEVRGDFDIIWIPYGDEATGKQDQTMLGVASGKGVIRFSNDEYWSRTVSSYPAYVYDSNSVLYRLVENYKTYLSLLGIISVEARLISYEELTALGCSSSSCSEAPSWVYATTYWTGSAKSSSNVWFIYSLQKKLNFTDYYLGEATCGVRPVITIAKSYF